MEKLTKIIRVRISENHNNLLGKNVSTYIRSALITQLEKDFPQNFKIPF